MMTRYCLTKSKFEKGFTIIELMLVTILLAAVGTMSLVGYFQFNAGQQLQNAAYDLSLVMQKAKSRAQSQVKPDSVTACTTIPLSAYEVRINAASKSYDIYIVCGATSSKLETKTLPSSISSITSTQPTYTFSIFTGAVNSGTIQLTSSNGTKKVIIDTVGNITIQ